MRNLLIVLALVLSFSVTARERVLIKGKVTDKEMNNESLPFVNIFVKGTTIRMITDFDGNYTLSLEAGEHVIVFSFLGYTTTEQTIVVEAGQNYIVNQAVGVSEGVLMDEVIVKASVSKESVTALLLEQKKAVVIKESIGAQTLLKVGVSDTADWGGLVICGKGITSAGPEVEFEVNNYLYGGDVAGDNSGSINYLVVRGSGGQIDDESQTNGISFCAVGSGKTVSNISVVNGGDGVEFYGDSLEVTNLYLENNSDDAIDWTEAWDGGVTNAYISHTDEDFSTAFEGDKANAMPAFENITDDIVYNQGANSNMLLRKTMLEQKALMI